MYVNGLKWTKSRAYILTQFRSEGKSIYVLAKEIYSGPNYLFITQPKVENLYPHYEHPLECNWYIPTNLFKSINSK